MPENMPNRQTKITTRNTFGWWVGLAFFSTAFGNIAGWQALFIYRK